MFKLVVAFVGLFSAYQGAFASLLYGAAYRSIDDTTFETVLISINPVNGTQVIVGSTGLLDIRTGSGTSTFISDLASSNTDLYGLKRTIGSDPVTGVPFAARSSIVTLDRNTGKIIADLQITGLSETVSGIGVRSLAYDQRSGDFFGSWRNNTLYRFDGRTGAATLIGRFGQITIDQDGVSSLPTGLAFDTFGRLWGLNPLFDLTTGAELGAYIVEINALDASYSVGTRVTGANYGDLAFDPDTGLGYITSPNVGEIFTFDSATRAIAKIGNPVSTDAVLVGLAFLTSDPVTAPEPSNLIIVGLFGILFARKRVR
jgi:hypothetical protein